MVSGRTGRLNPKTFDSLFRFNKKKKKGFQQKKSKEKAWTVNVGRWCEGADEGADTYRSERRKLADKGKVGMSSGLEKAQ